MDGELNFKGHQIYFIMPPDIELLPSNVMIFELVYLSSKSSSEDITMGWGAFPLVNGEFQLNVGKFKVPLLEGPIDYRIDAFKGIEQCYKRNIDEWLCNLYIEVKKIDMVDFKQYESKVTFRTKKTKVRTRTEKAKRIMFGSLMKKKDGESSSESSSSISLSDNSDEEDAN